LQPNLSEELNIHDQRKNKKQDRSGSNSNAKSSTLSLHISAYVNAIEEHSNKASFKESHKPNLFWESQVLKESKV
jgi:hypothetical protein